VCDLRDAVQCMSPGARVRSPHRVADASCDEASRQKATRALFKVTQGVFVCACVYKRVRV